MKRFSLADDYIQGICDIEEDPQGDWVKHSDFEKAVEASKKYIKQLEAEIGASNLESDYTERLKAEYEYKMVLKELGVE